MKHIFLTTIFTIATTGSASAHWGHVGDLAGHAHWLGVGAVIAAGLLGAALGKGLGERDVEAEEEENLEQETGEVA